MFSGWLLGSAFGGTNGFAGLLGGALVGIFLSVTAAERRGLVEKAEWSTVFRLSAAGLGAGSLVGILVVGNETVSFVAGVIGSGLGALLGIYIERFFRPEPPTRIF